MKGIGDGHTKSCTGCAFAVFSNGLKERYLGFVSKGSENGSDEQGCKKTEGHSSHGVDEIGFDSNIDVFSFQKCFYACLFHNKISFLWYCGT